MSIYLWNLFLIPIKKKISIDTKNKTAQMIRTCHVQRKQSTPIPTHMISPIRGSEKWSYSDTKFYSKEFSVVKKKVPEVWISLVCSKNRNFISTTLNIGRKGKPSHYIGRSIKRSNKLYVIFCLNMIKTQWRITLTNILILLLPLFYNGLFLYFKSK